MRIGYINETIGVELEASSEAPGYEVESLQDSRMTRSWQSALVGPSWIKVPGLVKATMACVNAHNAVSGDTIVLKGYTDAARTNLDTTITFDVIEYGTAQVFDEKTLYWTFEFDTASFMQVGGLFLGDHIISPHYEIGHSKRVVNRDSVTLSATNQLYGVNQFQGREASFILPFVDADSEAVEIAHLWKTVGRAKPFYLLQFPERQDRSPLFYCHFTDAQFDWQEHERNLNVYKDLPFNIQEVF